MDRRDTAYTCLDGRIERAKRQMVQEGVLPIPHSHPVSLCYRTVTANRRRTRVVSVHKSGTPRSPHVPQRRNVPASRARSKRATL
jgi:hypothetical protein